MIEKFHLSIEASITSLYAPEIRCKATGQSLVGQEIKIDGKICGQQISIIQAIGCSPSENQNILIINKEEFSFILAWVDIEKKAAPYTGIEAIKTIFAGIFPFYSQKIEIKFSGVGFPLTTSFHIELPHYLTRYTSDTENLQHVFSEGGIKSTSFMGGMCTEGEKFQMHLHYKSLDAFRRIVNPVLTMISVFYLDLATALAGGNEWRQKPAVVFGILCINTTAFANLAAIRVGSTTRSMLNMLRLIAVLWVLILTISIRSNGIPGLENIVDLGLKGCVVWLIVTAYFSFVTYSIERDTKIREKKFGVLFLIGFIIWIVTYFLLEPFSATILFTDTINNS